MAGLGNIYVDEVLFKAKVHPAQTSNQLSTDQVADLRQATIEVLQLGIEKVVQPFGLTKCLGHGWDYAGLFTSLRKDRAGLSPARQRLSKSSWADGDTFLSQVSGETWLKLSV